MGKRGIDEKVSSMRMLGDRVLIKPILENDVTPGGIIIPDVAKEVPVMGNVVAVGPGRVQEDGSYRKLEIDAGDRAIYGKYSGTKIMIQDEEYLIVREPEIFAIVEKGE